MKGETGKICTECGKTFFTHTESSFCIECYLKLKKELGMKKKALDIRKEPKETEAPLPKLSTKLVQKNNSEIKIVRSEKKTAEQKVPVKKLEEKQPPKPVEVPQKKAKEKVFQAGDIIPGYRMIKAIGQGGMGTVYLVEDRETKKQYALKTVKKEMLAHEEGVKRFVREADLHKQLDNQYVAKIHAGGEYKGLPYILMEYYPFGTVKNYCHKIATAPDKYEKMKELLIQILWGLDYLHHVVTEVDLANGKTEKLMGIVHRDLKPENIFIDYDTKGNVCTKIADFGLSKAFLAAGLSGNTMTGAAFGTYPYMPKQQIVDAKYARPEVDIWAAAATVYVLMTNQFPKNFTKDKDPALVCYGEKAVPIRKRNPQVPTAFAKIIDRALEDAKQLYYQNACDLIHDLIQK